MQTFMITVSLLILSQNLWSRSVFLNGEDVSSTRNQKLEEVSVFIDEDGHIHITSQKYKVVVEQTFSPLSSPSSSLPSPSAAPSSTPTKEAIAD